MLFSMTGYGKAENTYQNKTISVEIKSLNSKNCDINIRLPHILKEKELELRKQISQKLVRGKISCLIEEQYVDEQKAANINLFVVRNYIKQIKELSEELNIEMGGELLRTAIQMPDALERTEEELDDKEWKMVIQTLDSAMKELETFRRQEGEAIENDFNIRIDNISKDLKEVEKFDKGRIDRVRERINERFNEIKNDYEVDQQRFEQELVYYLEKFDITEEKVRLENHFKYFMEVMQQKQAVGKKLNFIAQEMGREINTIGSKANDSDIQRYVVRMKDELEKIKEQLMNVL